MSKAFSPLDTRELFTGEYQLLADFTYLDPIYGPVTAKKTFKTNYASIDVLKKFMMFLFYALLVKYGDRSATIHDWLYSGYGIEQHDGTIYYPSRKECDDLFHRALVAEGVARWRAWVFYWGVRIGGESHYTTTPVLWNSDGVMEA